MISIEEATQTDAPLLASIGTKTFIESHAKSAPLPDIEAYAIKNFSLIALENELKDHHNIFHIIYFKGLAAGYSKIILNKPHPLMASVNIAKLTERIL